MGEKVAQRMPPKRPFRILEKIMATRKREKTKTIQIKKKLARVLNLKKVTQHNVKRKMKFNHKLPSMSR